MAGGVAALPTGVSALIWAEIAAAVWDSVFKLGLDSQAVSTQLLQRPRPFHISNSSLNYAATIIRA